MARGLLNSTAMQVALLAMLLCASNAEAEADAATAAAAVEEELDLDEIEEPPPPPAPPAATGALPPIGFDAMGVRVRLMGRFDGVVEINNPMGAGEKSIEEDVLFKSYHHFLFVKVDAGEQLSLFAEVTELLFAELAYRPLPGLTLRGGKVLMPFGDEPFHPLYGGLQGALEDSLMVASVWAEPGAVVSYETPELFELASARIDLYGVRGIVEKDPARVLQLNRGAGETVALGARLTLRLAQARLTGSAYFDRYDGEHALGLLAADLVLDKGLIPLPLLSGVRLKAGLAYAYVENPTFGDYYKYGDYVELAYVGMAQYVTPRVRYGTYIDDSRFITARDRHNWSLALIFPVGLLRVTAEAIARMEEVDEIDDDLLRLMVAFEF